MGEKRRAWILTCLLLAGLTIPGIAAADSLKKALTDGEVDVDLRYRYESVDQEGFGEDAGASTARLRLGYETGRYHGFWGYVDFEVLRSIGGQTYNSTANGRTQYPVVADPEDEEVNQAFLAYKAPCKTTLKLGRQRIKIGNARFVGNVGWRQLEQTFDAFTIHTKATDRVSVLGGYVNNANRVFGEHHPVATNADLDLQMGLANVDITTGAGTISAYAHFIDNEDSPAASHRNLGVRFAGKRELTERTDLLYAAEYADQSDYEDAPSTVDAEYRLLELGADIDRWSVKLSHEVLGGDGTYAFQTPLATLHAFQGWADRFVVGGTPAAGLEDLYLSASRKLGSYKLLGVYHDFSADEGSFDYGTELDLMVAKGFGNVNCMLKYANYESDLPSGGPTPPSAFDTEIWWLMVHFKSER